MKTSKFVLLGLGLLSLGALTSTARAGGVSFSLSIGNPFPPAVIYHHPPVAIVPARPVCVPHLPVVFPPPVYCPPRVPVIVAPCRPVVARPVIYGHGYRGHRGHGGYHGGHGHRGGGWR